MTDDSPAPNPPATPPNTVTWDVKIGPESHLFWLFDTDLCKVVCHDVFTGKSYPLMQFAGEVKTIVDVGANVGAAAVYFTNCYPAARLFAFEPTPSSHALLVRNTAYLPQVKTYAFGLFDRDQQANLYHGLRDSVQNSICRGRGQKPESETVPLRETATVFRELAIETIDILKLDTEGCELPILLSMQPWIPQTAVIYVEFHSEVDRLEIDRLLSPTHYLCRGVISQFCRGELCYVAKNCLPPDLERTHGACRSSEEDASPVLRLPAH
jgi:FkbM family methyltransferase